MRIRVLGGGWYGCHMTRYLIGEGHEVVLHESSDKIFSGASGGIPARLHLGFHYPRSKLTRNACQVHYARFMKEYASLTRHVPINIYAIADKLSLVDFENYCQSLRSEVDFVRLYDPREYGLKNVEGALLTGERHVVIDEARIFFEKQLDGRIIYGVKPDEVSPDDYDLTIDCTFCAREAENVDRYEPCVTYLLEGPTTSAITIMDGPFPSLYPWNEVRGLCSLTSATLTPLSKTCKTYSEAQSILKDFGDCRGLVIGRGGEMQSQIGRYYPAIDNYKIVDHRLAIRAMPLSGSDARLVDIVQTGPKTLRVRASKLDAIFFAADEISAFIRRMGVK